MENIIWILLGIIGGGAVVYLIFGRKRESGNTDTGLNLILTQINELSRTVDSKIGDSQKQVNESLKFHSSESNKIIREITEELVRVTEGQKQVVGFADQLQDLQNILKNPKQRGTILGEYYLETILSRVLPPKTYKTQYRFSNNDIVDAVVFVKDKIIPIDSKFSLENYNRIIEANHSGNNPEPFIQEFKKDIKKRIDETSKYILPNENTLEFAFMFIPHESIYYDLLIAEVGNIKINTQDLVEYAFKKKVIMVSPTSFLAYLQTVLQGLNALQIEESARDIIKRVGELGNHLRAYEKHHSSIGSSINTLQNHFTKSENELKKIDKDILRISGSSPELNLLEVTKPKVQE